MWTSFVTRQIIGKNYLCGLRMASTGGIQPKLYVLQYDYVDDLIKKRAPYREAHLVLMRKLLDKGNIVLAGAVDDPPTGGLLIFRNLSRNDLEQLAQQDPYVINGLVKKYTIKPYMAVLGDALLNNDLVKFSLNIFEEE